MCVCARERVCVKQTDKFTFLSKEYVKVSARLSTHTAFDIKISYY